MEEKLHSEDYLVCQLRKGNKIAFKRLFDNYSARLYGFSLNYLRKKEDAEDLVHEVFLTIWEKRDAVRSGTSFKSYLFTIAYNLVKKQFLKKSRDEKYKRVFAEEFLLTSSQNEDEVDYTQLLEQVDKIIDLLPDRRKEIFILSRKDGMKNAEIAKRLGLSVQSVKNQLTIAKKMIADQIREKKDLASWLFFMLFI